jgi:hypothetical protein
MQGPVPTTVRASLGLTVYQAPMESNSRPLWREQSLNRETHFSYTFAGRAEAPLPLSLWGAALPGTAG